MKEEYCICVTKAGSEMEKWVRCVMEEETHSITKYLFPKQTIVERKLVVRMSLTSLQN